MRLKVYNVLKILFCVCILGAFALIFISDKPDWSAYMLLCLAGLAVMSLAVPRIPKRAFLPALCVFALALRIAAILLLKTEPFSDFALQYDAAWQIVHGDISYIYDPYFTLWGYQAGLVVYEAAILKIFGKLAALWLANAAFQLGSIVLVYLMARRLTSDIPARLSAVFYTVLLSPMVYVTVLSNSIPSAFFVMLAAYLMLEELSSDRLNCLRCLCAGVCCAAATFFRPDTVVLILAIPAAAIFAAIRDGKPLQRLGKAAIVLAVHYAIMALASWLMVALGFSTVGLKNGDFMWNFVVGLNVPSGGKWAYSIDAELLRLQAELGIDYAGAEREFIGANLARPAGELFELIKTKLRTFWIDGYLDFAMYDSPRYESLSILCRVQHRLLLLGSIVGAEAFFIYQRENGAYIVPFYIMATFCAYIITEVQPRYSYCVQMFLCVLCAYAFQAIAAVYSINQNSRRDKNGKTFLH